MEAVTEIAVAALSDTAVVVCLTHTNIRAECRLLTVDGQTLTRSDTKAVSGSSSYVGVSSFDATSAIVCYTDSTQSNRPCCNVVTMTTGGTALEDSSATEVCHSSTDEAEYVSVAALDPLSAMVCYKSRSGNVGSGRCDLVTRSGATHGAPLTWSSQRTTFSDTDVQYVSLAALDSQTVLACYSDASDGSASTCRRLYRGANGVSPPVGSLMVHPSASEEHSVARLGPPPNRLGYIDHGSVGEMCDSSVQDVRQPRLLPATYPCTPP